MADGHPVDDPALAVAARHALHDEELVAAFAAGATDDAEAPEARALVERCSTCAELARDIEAITRAVRAVDDAATASAYLRAPRDFRLTASDVGRRVPTGWGGRIAARFFEGVAAFGRPVGATLATFGLIGLLVGAASLAPMGASSAAAPGAAFATSAPAPDTVTGGAANAPASTAGDRTTLEAGPVASGRDDMSALSTEDDGQSAPPAIWLLFAGSIVVLVLGVALLLASSRARRRSNFGADT